MKSYFAEKQSLLRKENIVMVSVMPCVGKKIWRYASVAGSGAGVPFGCGWLLSQQMNW
ncbi:MAG: hypothetical protein ACLTDV_08140 [Eubacterium sp.]